MNKATNKAVRSYLTVGVATVTAATVAFVPSVAQPVTHPTATPAATVRTVSAPIALTAASQPLSVVALPTLLSDWLERIVVPPSASAPVPTPDVSVAPVATSIDSAIKNTYNAVEPWVRYGFELATYAVGWVPVVGWLAPQIMIFYNFGERITRSITFNVADFIGGNVSFGQGLRNVGRDTINSFITLANDELAFFLPPLPPIPPIGGFAAGVTTAKLASAVTPAPAVEASTGASTDPVTAEAPAVKTPERPIRPRDGGLANIIQRFTHREAPAGTTSVDVKTLGEEPSASSSGAETPARPRGHGIVAGLSSAVRGLVSSAPHPLRDLAAAATPKKDATADAGQP